MSKTLSDEQKDEIIAIAEARSPMEQQRFEEYRAALLLQSLLDGTRFTPRDVGVAQGMHDFDLDLADGRTFAVEVTSDKSQTDTAFQNQIKRINPLPAPGLAHSWSVLISSPGKDHTDQPAAGKRSKSLKSCLPGLLLQVESGGHFAEVKQISRYRSRGESELVDRLRGLGVRCANRWEEDAGEQRIVLRQAVLSGASGIGTLVDVVQEHLPRKRAKLVKAKDEYGADEAHLFIWLSLGEKHRFGRAEALRHVKRSGLDGLEAVDLQGVDAVWIALDASSGHAPVYPILCCDADGWHDRRMRRS